MLKADELYHKLQQATALLREVLLAGVSPADVSVNNIDFAGEQAYIIDYEGDWQRSLHQHLNRLYQTNQDDHLQACCR